MAVARKLLCVLYAMLRTRTPYKIVTTETKAPRTPRKRLVLVRTSTAEQTTTTQAATPRRHARARPRPRLRNRPQPRRRPNRARHARARPRPRLRSRPQPRRRQPEDDTEIRPRRQLWSKSRLRSEPPRRRHGGSRPKKRKRITSRFVVHFHDPRSILRPGLVSPLWSSLMCATSPIQSVR